MKTPLPLLNVLLRISRPTHTYSRRRQIPLLLRQYSPISSSDSDDEHHDFFRFTSGRWLWNEAERLREHYRPFNIAALKDIAVSAAGVTRCVDMRKLAEGGFNKVFRLTMDDDSTLIARIPNRTSDGVSRSLASEVATMDFASKILGIPVPRVLSWDANISNPVGSEYMLMKEARGTPLDTVWRSMGIRQKSAIVNELVALESKLLSASFSRYGSLYFAAGRLEGCEDLEVHGSVPPSLKSQAEQCYVIGPMAEDSFCSGERMRQTGVRGPWSSASQYLRAICEREMRWLRQFADPNQAENENAFAPGLERDPAVHIALYEKLLKASDHLLTSLDADLAKPVLWHRDLHASNIFVQDGKITDIIDWQDCWAGPLAIHARRPALLDYQGEVMLEFPPEYKDMGEGKDREEVASKVEQSILLVCYERETQESNPQLARVFRGIPHRETICQTVTFAANTWDNDPTMLRQCLMRIERHWNEICPNQPCPFAFTHEELDAHAEKVEGWNATADFWDSIAGFVSRDGFVRKEDYDEALAMFAELREMGLEKFKGEEREEFDKATRWAVVKA